MEKIVMRSRRLIAGILLAVGVSGIFYGVNMLRKDCIDRVEKKLDVELRNHVSVMKEQYSKEEGEEHISIKLLISDGHEDKIKHELKKCFSKECSSMIMTPNFHNTCPWWEMKETDIVHRYNKMVSGRHVKTIEIWAFIVEEDEKQYLYISY